MEKIALPKKIEFKQSDNSKEGIVIVEPLYPGYGNTIGNSLRRVLLSSLPGSAVVGVKIKGAKHEFMAMSGIKEDVMDIILNIKKLRVKVLADTDEIIKLELNVKGKKEVTAADIKKDSQVEIVSSDLVLANITDPAGNLSMDIYVSRGRGYFLTDKSKKTLKEVDYMEIDSIFSPVIGVSYKVENVRVGKMTNWDKLILEIKTDGTISLEDSFNQSVEIMINQFNALLDINKGINTEDVEIKKDDEVSELNDEVEVLEKPKKSKSKK